MFSSKNIGRAGNRWNCIPLLLFALLALSAFPALAEDCSQYPGGVLDGATGGIAPANINVDRNCTIRNFPGGMSTNFAFSTQPGQTDERWLIVFDNVRHTGQMACNAVAGHHIWFVNGSWTGIHANCQNLLIPVEKIVKENPAGQTTAAIGVPFTYTLTMPVLFDPATGTVINVAGSVNDLHSVTLTDDLNATGVDLTYVSHVAYIEGTTTPVPHTFDNVGGVLTFDNFPVIPAGQQIVLEITVVLEDSPANVLGTQFVNTAKWEFGRLIDGTFYEPLPGEWGISPPLTIGAPDLVMTKTGPTTLGRTLNLGEWGLFGLDVQNTGQFAAWNVTLLDQLPDGATGGMCDMTPQVLSARVFAANGTSVVPGKGPLVAGTDYTLAYNAASCELTMTMLTPAGMIAPTERLIVTYRTQLDVGSQNGITLTNFAGAVEWFNGDSSNVDRATFTRTLTNGTPGTLDHEDAHAVTVALYGFFFEKTVANVTTGVSPATTAAPGDTLRYTLRLQSTDVPLTGLTFRDDLGALATMFAPGTLSLVSGTLPPGADASNTNPTGGTNGYGLLDIRNLSLPVFSNLSIQFDVTLAAAIPNGTIVTNQAGLSNNVDLAVSDDPTVNGQADPNVVGDEDPTQVRIVSLPLLDVNKISTDVSGDPSLLLPGDTLRYTITVKNVGTDDVADAMLRDQIPANTTYVAGSTRLNGALVPDGAGSIAPLSTGIPLNAPENPTPGVLRADASATTSNVATIVFDVLVNSTLPGTVISNQGFVSAVADAIVDRPSDDPDTPAVDDPTLDVVGSAPVFDINKTSADISADPSLLLPGETLRYTITVKNIGTGDATDAMLRDQIPANTTYVAGSTQLNGTLVPDGAGGLAPLSTGIQVYAPENPTPGALRADASATTSNVATIVFDVLVNVGAVPGTVISNQGFVSAVDDAIVDQPSDDPDTPAVDDPTLDVVGAAPLFDINKTSTDISGDLALLLSGETLRYTITVKNVGTGDATDAMLRDQIPANTTYVAGSTRLNGTLVADGAGGLAPLSSGIPLNAPENPTPGAMRADASATTSNVATIVFDVLVDVAAIPGTVISNQGFVSAVADAIVDQPSDDPDTAAVDDPTLDVVGATPLFDINKTSTDISSNPNLLLPGETLRYTITVKNIGTGDATDAVLRDQIPANTTYVAGSTRLNGTLLPDGAGGLAPLSNGIALYAPENPTPGAMRADASATTSNVATIVFDVLVNASAIAGTVISNQGFVSAAANNIVDRPSDDPDTPAADDPTLDVVGAAALFDVNKISTDISGDPNLLLPGETLRYTITVKNVGTDDVADAMLRDQIPANTTYVAGSTRLNGTLVPDGAGGLAPLSNGIQLYAPENPTPGALRADASATTSNVATIVFDVLVNANVIYGTVISNQGFVSAIADNIVDQPSDDPDTAIVNDPTRDVVGTVPLLFAQKSVVIDVDGGTANVVDPGDVLRYTIQVYNNGTLDLTDVTLRDAVPANTTYLSDSTTLNGLPVGQPDSGVAPLVAGIPVSSSDLTPPLPGAGEGTLTAGQSAIVQFDLRVNAGVPTGTLISNQATVTSVELPDQLTDGDGNPATGPEPTVVVVGPAQQLRIVKQVAVVGGGPAVAGATLEYVVRVDNMATVPASYVSITDDLSMPNPGYLTYVDQSATLNGLTDGVTVVGPVITADYYAAYGPLAPNASVVLRFRAVLNANLAIGTRVTNTGTVFWNQTQQASASVSIDVGGVVGVGNLYGTAWHDANFDNVLDANERLLEGWTVELLRNGQRAHATLTAADGTYQIGGVVPNYGTTDTYELVFSAPGAGPNTALLGRAYSPTFTNGLQRISAIIVASGNVLRNLDLPIDPNGVVYDSVSRTPIAGAVLTLESASGVALPSSCFDDPAQQDQVTRTGGFYKFDLNFADPACPSGGSYAIRVTAPSTAYVAGYSTTIPPTSDASTAPFSVPTCPGSVDDALGGTLEYCEAQGSELQPSAAVPTGPGTNYYMHLLLDASQQPGSSQIFNNHIPLDPDLSGVVGITKTTQLFNVARGQLVPYTITVNSTYGATLPNLAIVDRFPAGFRYVDGSARLDGVAMEPTTVGRELIWSGVDIAASGEHTLQLLLAVGAGVSEGEYVNRAQVMSVLTGNAISGEASATVRLVPDPTFDCTDVTGKVFDDFNRNGVQDDGEAGLAGIRLVTARGLIAKTDEFGRYHINCAITPREGRGSNFVLKLDDRTLPTGFRASTEPVRIERATRGKTLRMNFGASIHRVVGLDIADAVFEPGSVEMRDLWKPRLELLLLELQKGPAVLRLSYVADLEDPDLVDKRLAAVKRQIEEDWMKLDCCYRLEVEPDVFWRLGGPPERAATPSASR